jgi:hypothetical protein
MTTSKWMPRARRRALRSVLVVSMAVCSLARCTPHPDPMQPGESSLAPPATITAAAAPASAAASGPPLETTGAPRGARSDPARFRCGDSSCRSAKETCCSAGDKAVCLASSANDGPVGAVGYLKTQWEACEGAAKSLGRSMTRIDRCDESSDCQAGTICCEQFLFSGGEMNECEPAPSSGKTPCNYGERCIEDATCRLPGTRCIEGYCQKSVVDLRCDQATCSGSTPVCCNKPSGCQAASACPSESRIRCTKNADCLAGQTCSVHGSATECTGLVIPTGLEPVCTRNADCRDACPDGKPARCQASSVAWLKSCQCP